MSIRGIMSQIKRGYIKNKAENERRAKRNLARAKTKAEVNRERNKLKVQQLKEKREMLEAKTATKKAEGALKKAKKEAGDFNAGSMFMDLIGAKRRKRKKHAKRK